MSVVWMRERKRKRKRERERCEWAVNGASE